MAKTKSPGKVILAPKGRGAGKPSTVPAASKQRVSKTAPKKTSAKKTVPKKTAVKRPIKRKPTDEYRIDRHESPERYYGTFEMDDPHVINKYLEIRTSPGKGRGIYTRVANIPAGTLILQETALLHDPKANTGNENGRLRKLVMSLSAEDQKKLTALTYHGLRNDEESRITRNQFGLTKKCSTVWFWIAMLNHDCKPNCNVRTEKAKGNSAPLINLRTLVPIPVRGTEISIDYVGWPLDEDCTVAERQALLQDNAGGWGFACNCPSCEDAEDTDSEFAELRQLVADIKLSGSKSLKHDVPRDRQVVDDSLDRYVDLLLSFRRIDEACDLLTLAVAFYSKAKDDVGKSLAVKWALEAMRVGTILVGAEGFEDANESALKGKDKFAANEPRFLPTMGHDKLRKDLMKLVSRTIPKLLQKKFYGNVRPLDGKGDVSEVPHAFYQ